MQRLDLRRAPKAARSAALSSAAVATVIIAVAGYALESGMAPIWITIGFVALGALYTRLFYQHALVMHVAEKNRTDLNNVRASFRHLYDAIPDSLITLDDEGRILDVNAATIALTGYTREELLELKVSHLSPEHLRGKIARLLPRAHAGGSFIDWICLRKDGVCVPVEVSYSTISIDGMQRVLVSGRDVSSRQKAARELKASEARYRSLFEQSLDGIYRSTPEGHYIDVNPALVEMLGYSSKEELLSLDIPKEVYFSQTDRRTADQRNTVFTNRLRRKDGSELWVEVTSWVVCDDNDQVMYYEGITRDVTERKRYEETIWFQAYHDALTGLPNRYLFNDRLNHALAQARRSQSMVGVMFLDLDHFKNINDTLGHAVGDQLLQMVSGRLQTCLREGDTVARLGGDEFTLLLQLNKISDTTRVAKRIHEVLTPPFQLDGRELHVTTSIGISIFPLDADDADTLLKNADTALYRSKEQGRNNHQLFNSTMNASAVERFELETALRQALDRREFVLHYQPIAHTGSGEISIVEALVRWLRPDGVLVPPDVFIPLAEETGLIAPIGEWVLHTACVQAKQWEARCGRPIHIAVNLSARQFNQQNLLQLIQQTLQETGLEPGSLTLEITENTALQNLEVTAATLKRLTELGVRVAIDDFGTGYSSLSLLKRLPLHTLKIDRSFVRNLTSDPGDAAIVSAVIAMAHSLRLEVVAEGVEALEQVQFLREQECDALQGYLISHPVPAQEFAHLLGLAKP